jgi:hypothetical protein
MLDEVSGGFPEFLYVNADTLTHFKHGSFLPCSFEFIIH